MMQFDPYLTGLVQPRRTSALYNVTYVDARTRDEIFDTYLSSKKSRIEKRINLTYHWDIEFT